MKRALAAVALAAATVAAPAQANSYVDARDPMRLMDIMKGFGSIELDQDNQGDPMLKGRVDGTKYTLFFYGCKGGTQCKAVQFYASWESEGQYNVKHMNEWNRDKRFAKAYIDEEGDPVLEMDVNLDMGVSAENFEDTAEWWFVSLKSFKSDIIDK